MPLIFRKAQLTSFAEIPGFTYADESMEAVMRRIAPSLIGLLLPGVALAAWGLGARRVTRWRNRRVERLDTPDRRS